MTTPIAAVLDSTQLDPTRLDPSGLDPASLDSAGLDSALPHGSPWGDIDAFSVIADGVYEVSTPSHGGIYVSPAARVHMPAALLAFAPFSGEAGWYEEDCDWAIPTLAFAARMEAKHVIYAYNAVNSRPAYYGEAALDWLHQSDAASIVREIVLRENSRPAHGFQKQQAVVTAQ
jgi:hypothetical protein